MQSKQTILSDNIYIIYVYMVYLFLWTTSVVFWCMQAETESQFQLIQTNQLTACKTNVANEKLKKI